MKRGAILLVVGIACVTASASVILELYERELALVLAAASFLALLLAAWKAVAANGRDMFLFVVSCGIGSLAASVSAFSILEWHNRTLGLLLAALSLLAFIVAARQLARTGSADTVLRFANPFGLWVMTTLLILVLGPVVLTVVKLVKEPHVTGRVLSALVAALLASTLAALMPWIAVHLAHWLTRLVQWLISTPLALVPLAAVVAAAVIGVSSPSVYVRLPSALILVLGAIIFIGLFVSWVLMLVRGHMQRRRGLATGAEDEPAIAGARHVFASRVESLVSRTGTWSFEVEYARLWRCLAMGLAGIALSLLAQWISYRSHASDQRSDVYWPFLGWSAGSVIGWTSGARLFKPPELPLPARHVAHGAGLATAVVLIAAIPFAYRSTVEARTSLFPSQREQTTRVPGIHLDGRPLVDRFAPVFRFAKGEKWHPTSVDWYRANSTVEKQRRCEETCRSLIRCNDAQRKCAPCDVTAGMCEPCDDRNGDCAPDSAAPSVPMVYVVTKRLHAGDMPPEPDDIRDPDRDYSHVDRIVQYWIFYNYDSFDRFVIAQWHQSDWEAITVGLVKGVPRFVGYSAHCFGIWLPWNRVPVSDATHPIAWVARGTHANYPAPIEPPLRGGRCPNVEPPKYLGAAGIGFGLVEAGGSLEVPADLAAGLTDRTGDDHQDRAIPARFVEPNDPDVASRGNWGLDNNIEVARLTHSKSASPNSPTDHFEWKQPGAAILCNTKWFAPHDAKPAEDSCKLIAGTPFFRAPSGIYCAVKGRRGRRELACWRPSDGRVWTLGQESTKTQIDHNDYARQFLPTRRYSQTASGVVRFHDPIALKRPASVCSQLKDKREECIPPAVAPPIVRKGDVIFTCTISSSAIGCTNLAGHALSMSK